MDRSGVRYLQKESLGTLENLPGRGLGDEIYPLVYIKPHVDCHKAIGDG